MDEGPIAFCRRAESAMCHRARQSPCVLAFLASLVHTGSFQKRPKEPAHTPILPTRTPIRVLSREWTGAPFDPFEQESYSTLGFDSRKKEPERWSVSQLPLSLFQCTTNLGLAHRALQIGHRYFSMTVDLWYAEKLRCANVPLETHCTLPEYLAAPRFSTTCQTLLLAGWRL